MYRSCLPQEVTMKRHKTRLLTTVLLCLLLISLSLSCDDNGSQSILTEWDWSNCPAGVLADDIATRTEDLPAGWVLWDARGGPSYLWGYSIQQDAFVQLEFRDGKPWNDPRRQASNNVYLYSEEAAISYYFRVPAGSIAADMNGVDEAYIRVKFEEVLGPGDLASNCTVGAELGFRKGLYEVRVSSYNWDLRDLCIEEGEEVDAELAFVTDLATKVASRIP